METRMLEIPTLERPLHQRVENIPIETFRISQTRLVGSLYEHLLRIYPQLSTKILKTRHRRLFIIAEGKPNIEILGNTAN
jgi:hypothetical protein